MSREQLYAVVFLCTLYAWASAPPYNSAHDNPPLLKLISCIYAATCHSEVEMSKPEARTRIYGTHASKTLRNERRPMYLSGLQDRMWSFMVA